MIQPQPFPPIFPKPSLKCAIETIPSYLKQSNRQDHQPIKLMQHWANVDPTNFWILHRPKNTPCFGEESQLEGGEGWEARETLNQLTDFDARFLTCLEEMQQICLKK